MDAQRRAAFIRYALTYDKPAQTEVSPPYTCEYCPFGAKTREPYAEISNDLAEAHYICPILVREVWGENPQRGDALTGMLREELERVQDIDPEISEVERERAAKEALVVSERERIAGLRKSARAKLTDEEAEAIGLRMAP